MERDWRSLYAEYQHYKQFGHINLGLRHVLLALHVSVYLMAMYFFLEHMSPWMYLLGVVYTCVWIAMSFHILFFIQVGHLLLADIRLAKLKLGIYMEASKGCPCCRWYIGSLPFKDDPMQNDIAEFLYFLEVKHPNVSKDGVQVGLLDMFLTSGVKKIEDCHPQLVNDYEMFTVLKKHGLKVHVPTMPSAEIPFVVIGTFGNKYTFSQSNISFTQPYEESEDVWPQVIDSWTVRKGEEKGQELARMFEE